MGTIRVWIITAYYVLKNHTYKCFFGEILLEKFEENNSPLFSGAIEIKTTRKLLHRISILTHQKLQNNSLNGNSKKNNVIVINKSYAITRKSVQIT